MKLTLETLYNGVGFIKEIENLDDILNSEPKKEWLKTHEQISKYKYLPVQKVEFLLHRLFKGVHFEIRHLIKDNDCSVSVRVHYEDRDGKLMFQDGIASCQINKLQPSEMAFPKAKSIAIINAARSMGRIFGRDLNRNDESLSIVTTPISDESIFEKHTLGLLKCDTLLDIKNYFDINKVGLNKQDEAKLKSLCTKRTVEING